MTANADLFTLENTRYPRQARHWTRRFPTSQAGEPDVQWISLSKSNKRGNSGINVTIRRTHSANLN
jgi:hypothetical protein